MYLSTLLLKYLASLVLTAVNRRLSSDASDQTVSSRSATITIAATDTSTSELLN